jgi:AAA domain
MSGRTFLEEKPDDPYWHEERPILHWQVDMPVFGESSGFDFLDAHLRWTNPELVVVAGPYGCGKSSLTRLLGYRWADTIGRRKGKRVSIVGWEDNIADVKAEIERYAVAGRVNGSLRDGDAQRIVDMHSRIGWTQRHPEEQRLIDWYCALVEQRAYHEDVGFFVFDPFNEHDTTRGKNQTETEYVAAVMLKLHKLVKKLDIILVVVTHVSAKSYDETGAIKPFRVANAAGSVQFGNRADRGICMLRASTLAEKSSIGAHEHMILHFDKCRNEARMGKRGTIACMFDPAAMRLEYDRGATQEARKIW